jgi:hypothetical protein
MDVVIADTGPAPESASPPTDGARGERLTATFRRLGSAIRWALPALAGYAVVRAVGVVTVYVWAHGIGQHAGALLTRADGNYYLRIARQGYDGYARVQSDMAFFPLYPKLVGALDQLSPLNLRHTALAVAWAAGLAAAWGLFAIGNHLHGRRAGVLLAVLWGVLPHSIVQSMSYSEGLFTALAAWTLYALLRGRWVSAGVLCLLAGLTRPTGSSLIAVVGLAALIAIVRRRDGWRPWLALLLAPAGWLGYLAWVGTQTGRPDGWFHIQSAGWRSSFDFGVATGRRAQEILSVPSALQNYMSTLTMLLAITLLVLCALDRQHWHLLLFSALMIVTTVGTAGYYHAKSRFLLPAFPLLLPIAVALARAGWARALTVLTPLLAISAYYGGYVLMIWHRSP